MLDEVSFSAVERLAYLPSLPPTVMEPAGGRRYACATATKASSPARITQAIVQAMNDPEWGSARVCGFDWCAGHLIRYDHTSGISQGTEDVHEGGHPARHEEREAGRVAARLGRPLRPARVSGA
jgi:hypothetical protein